MKLHLRYDRDGLEIDLPAGLDVEVLRLNPLPPIEDEAASIEASFFDPIGSAPLPELARGRESAVIVICDVTRPVPNEKILLPMLRILEDEGIPTERITILVATGLHRPNVGQELEEMIGSLAGRYRVVNHDARDTAAMTPLGEVSMGLDDRMATVAVNSEYIRHDLKITVGLIEPHFMAGYSGGRKLVCPGVASAETILQFHSPPMIGHPAAHAGNLIDNPVHHMSRAVAGLAGVDFICNVTLSEERAITGVFSGDLDQAHHAGIEHVDKQTKVPVRLADIVITTGAGYPLDTTLYQTIKGMVCALPAIKPGGTLIIAAGMSQGVGGEEFAATCRSLTSADAFLDHIYNSPVEIDQWQLQEMMLAVKKCRIVVVTEGVDTATLNTALLDSAPSIEAALEEALERHGRDAAITIIPEGPYVTPDALPVPVH
jgi:nickel-dependent lactate racemase